MTWFRSMHGKRRRVVATGSILVAILVLAGCGAVSSLLDTENGLRDAGYQSVSVKPSGNDVNTSVTVAAVPTEGDVQGVARVIWRDFHERFDNLNITVHGQGQSVHQSLTFDQVQQLFGPRDPAWNRTTLQTATERVGLEILVGVVAAAAVVLAIVLIVVRRRRRQRPPGPFGPPGPPGPPGAYPGYPPYYPPPAYPPSPPGPGSGWGPPPPSG